MDPFLEIGNSQSGRALKEGFAPHAQSLVEGENFFLTPIKRSWDEVLAQGTRTSAFLATRSFMENARRLSTLPENTDLSRLRPAVVTLVNGSELVHYLIFVGSQVTLHFICKVLIVNLKYYFRSRV